MGVRSLGNALSNFGYKFGRTGNEASGPNAVSFSASGGTEIISGSNTYHIFTSNGNFVTQASSTKSFRILMVGGGAGGGASYGFGGSGMIVVQEKAYSVPAKAPGVWSMASVYANVKAGNWTN